MSSLWLLQPLEQEDGGGFWLKPGVAVLGRQGAVDAVIGVDKSISRRA